MSESRSVSIPGLLALMSGYNIFGTYANWDSHKALLFVADDLEDVEFRGDHVDVAFSKPRWIAYGEVKAGAVWEHSGQSIHEYSTKLSSRTDVKGAYGAFKGEVGVNFSQDESQSLSHSYAAFEVLLVKWDLSMPTGDLRQHLTAEARRDLDDATKPAKDVLALYGTHYVKSLRVGGKASRYTSTDTTKFTSATELEVSAKMSYKNAVGKLSADEKVKYAKTLSKFDQASTATTAVRGGDTGLANQVFSGQFDAWCASVEASPVFVDFPPDDALEGIWTLAASQSRQDALKAAFDQLVNDQFAVKYGDEVYLEVAGRYLDGARSNDNESVDSRAFDAGHDANYRWIFSKTSGKDQFLRYGDTVKIRVKARDDRWLTGCRGNHNEHVYTRDPAGDDGAATSYTWKIQKDRATTGSGPVLLNDSTIYLQCQSGKTWLSGGRGDGNTGVVTRDGESGMVEDSYRWIAKRKPD